MGLLLMGVQLENLDGLTIDGHTIRKLVWAYYRIIFCRLTFGSNFFSNFFVLAFSSKNLSGDYNKYL